MTPTTKLMHVLINSPYKTSNSLWAAVVLVLWWNPPPPTTPIKNKKIMNLFYGQRSAVSRLKSNNKTTFDEPRKDESLSRLWSHSVSLKPGPLKWESSILTTRPLLHKNIVFDKVLKMLAFVDLRTSQLRKVIKCVLASLLTSQGSFIFLAYVTGFSIGDWDTRIPSLGNNGCYATNANMRKLLTLELRQNVKMTPIWLLYNLNSKFLLSCISRTCLSLVVVESSIIQFHKII